jgi:hypothetical protein
MDDETDKKMIILAGLTKLNKSGLLEKGIFNKIFTYYDPLYVWNNFCDTFPRYDTESDVTYQSPTVRMAYSDNISNKFTGYPSQNIDNTASDDLPEKELRLKRSCAYFQLLSLCESGEYIWRSLNEISIYSLSIDILPTHMLIERECK